MASVSQSLVSQAPSQEDFARIQRRDPLYVCGEIASLKRKTAAEQNKNKAQFDRLYKIDTLMGAVAVIGGWVLAGNGVMLANGVDEAVIRNIFGYLAVLIALITTVKNWLQLRSKADEHKRAYKTFRDIARQCTEALHRFGGWDELMNEYHRLSHEYDKAVDSLDVSLQKQDQEMLDRKPAALNRAVSNPAPNAALAAFHHQQQTAAAAAAATASASSAPVSPVARFPLEVFVEPRPQPLTPEIGIVTPALASKRNSSETDTPMKPAEV